MDSVLLIHPSAATDRQLLLAIFNRQEKLMPEITELIAGLRTAIADEVAEAITNAQARIDEAVSNADTAEEARSAAVGELGRLKDEVRTLTEEVRAPGLIGQDGNQPEEPEEPGEPGEPGDGEPTDPEEPEEPGEPDEDEPTTPGDVF